MYFFSKSRLWPPFFFQLSPPAIVFISNNNYMEDNMSKPLRNIGQGLTHHTYSRCHDKRNLLMGKYGKIYFIESIKMCQEIYDFELIAAEIVGNHIHLVIKTNESKETISRIMQYIKSRIAEKYNRAMGRSGSFWNERFGSSVVEEADNPEEYLLWLLWYIGYNPVRKALSNNPRHNDIGFINCYLDRNFQAPFKITLHHFFCKLGNTFEECVRKFLLYEDAYRRRLAVYF
jgi:REP element-mobilizing transposase RayT